MPQKAWPAPSLARRIAAEECAAIGVADSGIVFSRDRTRVASWLRAKVSQRLLETGRYSLPGIGHALGGIDHTTVIYHSKRDLSVLPFAKRTYMQKPRVTQPMRLMAYLRSIAPACATYDDLAAATGFKRSAMRQVMSVLHGKGAVVRVDDGIHRCAWRAVS